ncbi:hypothetical protein ACFLWV_03960 [Chloroflexota bacterium]
MKFLGIANRRKRQSGLDNVREQRKEKATGCAPTLQCHNTNMLCYNTAGDSLQANQ